MKAYNNEGYTKKHMILDNISAVLMTAGFTMIVGGQMVILIIMLLTWMIDTDLIMLGYGVCFAGFVPCLLGMWVNDLASAEFEAYLSKKALRFLLLSGSRG